MQNYSSQEFEIDNYCRLHNLKIDKWYSEAISGTKPIEKRILGRVIRKMNSGDLLICTEISRLGRNMLMIMSILNICADKGIHIQTIKDNFTLSDNINSKIIAFAFALAAEIERNLISQRTCEALAVKKLEGTKLGRPAGSSKKKETFPWIRWWNSKNVRKRDSDEGDCQEIWSSLQYVKAILEKRELIVKQWNHQISKFIFCLKI